MNKTKTYAPLETTAKRTHYLITDTQSKSMICTHDYNLIFDFIVVNKNSKIRTIDHTAKPSIMDRTVFLTKYYSVTKNTNNFFELAKILIKREDNRRKLFSKLNLLETFDYYEKNKNTIL